jgi:outer membrane protein OmpA-like peptidoglycan-associated protein
MGKSDILIEGHTDSLGGKSVNKSLSMNRALSVKDYLVKHDKNRYLDVKANGLDYQRPLATNATPGGRALNRRVEIRVLPVSSDYYRQDKSTVREAWPLL